jgi:ankyrin repeat protein
VNEDVDGRPPILYAADYGQREVIEYLLSKGANVNVKWRFSTFASLTP